MMTKTIGPNQYSARIGNRTFTGSNRAAVRATAIAWWASTCRATRA